MLEINVRASGFETVWKADSGTWGVMAEMMVRTVWRGSSGNHDSSLTSMVSKKVVRL